MAPSTHQMIQRRREPLPVWPDAKVRGCNCGGHVDPDDSEAIEVDYTCIICGWTVPTCEGGGVWDDVACNWNPQESHVGVCAPCSNRLDRQYPLIGDYNLESALALANLIFSGHLPDRLRGALGAR